MSSLSSREELRKYQERRLLAMLKYVYENSPYYHKKFNNAGIKPSDIKSVEDFYKKIPFTSKLELIQNQRKNPPFGEFLCVNLSDIRRIFISPGPIFEPYTENDLKSTKSSIANLLKLTGIGPSDIVQVTFTYHFMPAGLVFHLASEELGCSVIPAGPGETRLQIDIMKKLGTTVYVGTPSFLARIAEEIKRRGLDPLRDFKLKIGICGAEPLPPKLRNQLEETFNIEIYDAYGVAEIGLISIECNKHKGMHINEDALFIEIIDPDTGENVEPGEQGEIVATHLFREAMPLIRYRTGDISMLDSEPCECGNISLRLSRILGRVDAMTKVKGVFIHPHLIKEVIEKYPELGRYQVIIERPGTIDILTVKVECRDIRKIEDFKRILPKEFKEALKIDTNVEVVGPGEIPSTAKVFEDRRRLYV